MKVRFVCGPAILAAMFLAPLAMAQTDLPDSSQKFDVLLLEPKRADTNLTSPVPPPEADPFKLRPKSAVRFSKAKFVLPSIAVYGAALADMHETLEKRKFNWWYETDPIARPLVRLPAPAYYATGLALATGINWLSWKMANSRRWRKLSFIPQALSIGGNLHGYHSNRQLSAQVVPPLMNPRIAC